MADCNEKLVTDYRIVNRRASPMGAEIRAHTRFRQTSEINCLQTWAENGKKERMPRSFDRAGIFWSAPIFSGITWKTRRGRARIAY